MIQLKQVPKRNPHTAWRFIEGEVVIMQLSSAIEGKELSRIKVFNNTASRIWEVIDGTRNIEEITSIINLEFEVAYDQLLSDALEFLDQLVTLQLISVDNI
jgi:hypothetical protein